MASKAQATAAFLLGLNLLLFSLVSATYSPCHPYPKPGPKPPCGGGGGGGRPAYPSCPRDTLKLSVCANVLGLVNVVLGNPTSPCCTLLKGLADLEAAACLCTALKANVLGINLNIPISLSVLLNYCGRNAAGYKCA